MLLNQLTNSPIVVILILVWLSFLTFLLIRTIRHYRYLISKVKKGDLKSILEEILSRVEKQGKGIDDLDNRFKKAETNALGHLQKIGFVRFNPFSDTGGDQSFSLGLLDGEDNGIVLSSLHSRGQTRLYSKIIKNGKPGDLELSKEEEEAIKKAKKGKI
jgi:hypothetical protein